MCALADAYCKIEIKRGLVNADLQRRQKSSGNRLDRTLSNKNSSKTKALNVTIPPPLRGLFSEREHLRLIHKTKARDRERCETKEIRVTEFAEKLQRVAVSFLVPLINSHRGM